MACWQSRDSAVWTYSNLHKPITHSKTGQYIDIPKGTSPSAIITKLAAEGIIQHEWPLKLYLKLTGKGSTLRAGEYDFPSPISPLGVLAKLQQGQRRLNRLTIIEGWTRWDIARAMAQVPEFKLENDAQALELMNNVSLISDLDPVAKNLEGYLFPDTYEFSPETTPAELIEMMVKRFRNVWKPDWTERARSLGFTPRQIVTTASIIETEAKLADERPLVASVIYNRLKKDIPLAVDSSVIYASKLEGKWRYDGKVYLQRHSKTLAVQHQDLCRTSTGTSCLPRRELAQSRFESSHVRLSLLRSQSRS